MKTTWETLARGNGWVEADRDPNPEGPQTPCLLNDIHDRAWPAGDWEGACRDLGLDESDLAA